MSKKKEEKLIQQVHKGCGGEIVAVTNKDKEIKLICKKCRAHWMIERLYPIRIRIPEDFEDCATIDKK